ncbi:hypothetical protein Pyn_39234 [Prunus yedoensis var. nudiflora]|uniref:Protein kinase domain-containing protein n=1 Tax=Prunus yedoensis var. nudiflora TaxID=2094558 RepID=A0A314XJT6_PRUYE|nr:hypothetical protein Pyn_39234 [Prunus yedoensis var. nudiflora]
MVRLGTKARIFTEAEVKDKDATNNYDKRKKVGEGGYGIVYKGMLKVGSRNETVAIKRSKVSVLIDDQKQITDPIE